MDKLVLIAGLPRSGSTLLCNILNMNPRFHATSTSPIIDVIKNIRSTYSHNITYKTHDRINEYNQMCNALKSFIDGYYYNNKVIFDKSRGWTSYLKLLDELYHNEDIKIIWTYRDPVQIVNSIENRYQKTILLENSDEISADFSTLSKRVDMFINDGSIIGRPVWLLNDIYDMGLEDRILIVKYGDLTLGTQSVMNQIHEFIGENKYQYNKNNFTDLKQSTYEFDGFYNYKFPHTIKEGGIKYVEHDINLPQYLIDRINSRFTWINNLIK